MDELLDLVNEEDEVIGTVFKSAAHANPALIHREMSMTVFSKNKTVLLQRRSMEKSVDPGMWKLSAAGHIESGEDPVVGAKREVLEELGLEFEPVFYSKHFSERGDKEARFVYDYYVVLDEEEIPTLQEEEVMDFAWVPVHELEDFAENNNYDLTGYSHKLILEIAEHLKFI